MLKRARWLTVGVVLGIAATLWVRHRLLRRLDRAVATVLPGGLSGDAATTLREAGARVRAAIDAGRDERARREAELWAELEREPRHAKHARPAATAHRRRPAIAVRPTSRDVGRAH